MKTIHQLTQTHSINAFMNSFFRDYSGEGMVFKQDRELFIPLGALGQLRIPLLRDSILGKHRTLGIIYHCANGALEKISLSQAIELIFSHHFGHSCAEDFIPLVENSATALSQSLLSREHERDTWSIERFDYLRSEQSLLLGHPFHPYPKACIQFSREERFEYLSEHGNPIRLSWIAVRKDILYSKNSKNFNHDWHSELARRDLLASNAESFFNALESDEYVLIPTHPWQWKVLKYDDDVKKYLEQQDIIEVGSGACQWFATSSQRSLYCPKLKTNLKFSMSLKLTNSIRHLSASEVVRGLQVDEVFGSDELFAFKRNYPFFDILREPACVGILDNSGGPIDKSFVLLRETVDHDSVANTHLLATLAQDCPWGGDSLLVDLVKKYAHSENIPYEAAAKNWLKFYFERCVEPLMELACNYGILLGAHMQNILVQMKDHLPEKVFFRDCQGSGFTEIGFRKFGALSGLIEEANGNVLEQNSAQAIFLYYLGVNNLFGVISALAGERIELESRFLSVAKGCLFSFGLRALEDRKLFDALYSDQSIMQKGNFRCSVIAENENMMSNPASLYNSFKNPFSGLRSPTLYPTGTLFSKAYAGGKKVSFRRFELNKHLELFHQWHHQDYVSDFWEMAQTKNELERYIEKLLISPFQLPLIFEVEDRPVGYFEVYWAYEDRIAPYCSPDMYDRGIHLLIGERSVLGTRYVLDAINLVSEFIFHEEPKTKRIWAEPRADNRKILKIAEKLPGWRFIREFDFPHKKAALLVNERECFQNEIKEYLA